MKRHLLSLLAGCLLATFACEEAAAQRSLFRAPTADYYKSRTSGSQFTSKSFTNRAFNSALPRGSNLKATDVFGSVLRPQQKPFANAQRKSNLSPYLNLGGLPAGDAPNYHTLVRPQLDHNAQQRRSNNQRRRAPQAPLSASRGPYSLSGATDLMPTGHSATYQNLSGRFLNYSGYYR